MGYGRNLLAEDTGLKWERSFICPIILVQEAVVFLKKATLKPFQSIFLILIRQATI
jgi:hypothetical protein